MQAEKLAQVKASVLKIRQELRAGKLYQSLPQRMGAVIDQVTPTPATTVNTPEDDILDLVQELRNGLDAGTLTEITDQQLEQLLSHVGSLNPAIRDRGCYYLLNEALQQQLLTADQLGAIFDRLVQDDVLFAHIDEPANDAVFQRSFAILLLSVLLYADHAGITFMTSARLQQLVSQFTVYLLLEADTRGFVGDHGWAHAYTHIGNLLDELADEAQLARADKLLMLAAMLSRYQRLSTPLIFGEPERLSTYLALITNKDELYSDYMLMALKGWHRAMVMQTAPSTEAAWTRVFNRNRLLEAMALHDDFPTAVVDYLDDELEFLG
ncbi:DUF2785 domain-containing protein [Lactiplantibacillus garii]|uniref:DUF2785 domain-containing protein n=1 Tax=Lactiplantibacillus garii TaxID=2306423 RepID=A0A3R8QRS3_9LACO|nr:DUF2785 domain-containing protein [Lactiplantibacillus garii]RRK10773.1 DUF2785 domain-containing protein [Lactiplantibacillus garii]